MASEDVLLLQRMDFLADCIMAEKEQKLELDKKRQFNREALNQIKKNSNDEKVWYISGSLFMKLPVGQTKSIIQKEQDNIEKELRTVEESIKKNTKELLAIEGRQNELKGFDLTPINLDELNNDEVRMMF